MKAGVTTNKFAPTNKFSHFKDSKVLFLQSVKIYEKYKDIEYTYIHIYMYVYIQMVKINVLKITTHTQVIHDQIYRGTQRAHFFYIRSKNICSNLPSLLNFYIT